MSKGVRVTPSVSVAQRNLREINHVIKLISKHTPAYDWRVATNGKKRQPYYKANTFLRKLSQQQQEAINTLKGKGKGLIEDPNTEIEDNEDADIDFGDD